jgi:exopolysaccharide production protein ExoQ
VLVRTESIGKRRAQRLSPTKLSLASSTGEADFLQEFLERQFLMPNAPKHRRAEFSSPTLGVFTTPTLACAYALIISPMLIFFTATPGSLGGYETRNENKFFWPALAGIAVIIAAHNLSRGRKVSCPPHILCLLAYLALAGMSILWAFAPPLSAVRFAQQVMIVTSIVLPVMLAGRSADLLRGLFLCFAFAVMLNVLFVFGGYQTIADKIAIGYSGYFQGKNYLGECGAIAFLLAIHEMLYRGLRRMAGVVLAVTSLVILVFANSKTALGLAFLAPLLAGFFLFFRRAMRVSPALLLWLAVLIYIIFAKITGFTMNRLSYMLYGDSSFTGRQVIWDFANFEIARRPLLGWGYQSFWLVGPSGPSIVDAPGWVKTMPNAHNGYYDTILELGYIGFTLLLAFITATLHSIRRVIDQDPRRGWVLLSLALFIGIYNGLESAWMRGFEFMWVVFLIIAAEIVRFNRSIRVAGNLQLTGGSSARSRQRRLTAFRPLSAAKA